MKNKLLLALNISVLPIFLGIYLLDRFILLPLIWMEAHSIQDWIGDNKKMGYSIVRAIIILLIFAIISLIKSML